eukprot:comp17704_c1_seq1/m.17592 comp17704_c1_seq1/g.17592  ORF comp17704_c1_seq1/g.17592 comp17704_c1_seq1/m.17592 type:complete len:757 (-) comp17704_c1_seq1:13-2283(-)
MACACTKKLTGILLVAFGALFIILGLLLGLLIVPDKVGSTVDGKIIPANNEESISDYSKPKEAPLYDSVHIFNLTNKEAWLNGTAKPHVQDLGAYTVQTSEQKINTTVSPDGCTVTFYLNKTMTYTQSESNASASLDDPIYMLNTVLLGAATFFKGMGPGVQASILPHVLTTLMTKIGGLTLTGGVALNADLLGGQFAQLPLTRALSASPNFTVTPGIVALFKAGKLPGALQTAVAKLVGPPESIPARFALEPAAFFRDFPGKNVTVTYNGETKVVAIPSTKEIWPDFSGFTPAEGSLFVKYMNGTPVMVPIVGPMALPTLIVALVQGLKGEGLADAFVLMGKNDTNAKAKTSVVLNIGLNALNFTSAPCKNATDENCAAIASRLNVVDATTLSKLWMLTVLNEYLAAFTDFSMNLLDAMNFGLVIKGTARDWLYGFSPIPNVKIPGILKPGLDPVNRTAYTGACDDLTTQSWALMGGKPNIDPRIFPTACPGLNESTTANCPAWKIQGRDGTQFPRAEKISWANTSPRLDEYKVWVTEMSRYLPLLYTYTDVEREGIKLNRFRLPKDVLSAASYNNSQWYGITCDGLLEGPSLLPSPSPMIPDARASFVAVSRPHFLYGDPKCTTDLVDGLNPTPEIHDSVLDIEPFSGATMNALKALQGSLLPLKSLVGDSITPALSVQNVTGATAMIWGGLFNELKYAPIPYYYILQRSTITPLLADKFKNSMYPPVQASYGILIAFPIVGGLMVLAGGGLIL